MRLIVCFIVLLPLSSEGFIRTHWKVWHAACNWVRDNTTSDKLVGWQVSKQRNSTLWNPHLRFWLAWLVESVAGSVFIFSFQIVLTWKTDLIDSCDVNIHLCNFKVIFAISRTVHMFRQTLFLPKMFLVIFCRIKGGHKSLYINWNKK